MKIKRIAPVIILISVFISVGGTVYAEPPPKSITAESLTDKVYGDLIEYKEIELNDKKTKLDDHTVKKYIDETERQIESNDKSIEQAKSKLNSLDISDGEINQCRYQIEYLKINSFELQRSKYYYETQNKLSELYEEYSEKIVQDQKNRLKYETYRKLCEIKVYESQNDYLKVFAEYKKNNLDVLNKSFEIGYATENGVLSAKAEYASAKSELSVCENSRDDLISGIEKDTGYGLDEYTLDFPDDNKYDSEKYLEEFKKQSFYSEYYLKQSEIYGEYFKSLNELVMQMDKEYNKKQYKFLFSDNEDFFDRTYKYISDEKNYYENESEIYKLNSEKYLSELESYIAGSCGDLNTLISRRSAKLAELKAAESSYKISQGLLNEGRINELDLIEAKCNLEKVKFELLKIEADILVIKYALDNGVIN